MQLRFGAHVLEHGYHIGRLSGIDVDPTTRTVLGITFRSDSGSQEETRPLDAVNFDHFRDEIDLHLVAASRTRPATTSVRLTDVTSVVRADRPIGQLSEVEVAADTGTLSAVFERQHWWTRQLRFDAAGIDLSVPGEIRIRAAPSGAAQNPPGGRP